MTTRKRRGSLHRPEFSYEVVDFSGGYLDSPEPSKLAQGATPAAANCLFTKIQKTGQCNLGKRTGCRPIITAALTASKRIDGLYEFRPEGVTNATLLIVCNGSLYTWDGAALTFTLIGAGGWTAGLAVQFHTFRNLVFISDGLVEKFFDGVALFTPGIAAPTAPGALTAVAPAGAGVTGTYQDVFTWYDSAHDHESSPTAFGTATVLVAQDRQHAKPAGAPPAQVDKWRVYTRRTDTNETYFKLVAEVAVAAVTATEAVTDIVRQLAATLTAPLPNANDVPPVFVAETSFKGYRFGAALNDSYVQVSALGDGQSQHPKDKIGVARGHGGSITTFKVVGTELLIQKNKGTYHVTGEQMPFLIPEFNPSWGNKQQDSSVEAKDRYWAWDEERGPYWTDLAGQWVSLVDGQIKNTFKSINRLGQVRCAHFPEEGLVAWLVATGSSTRLRTMLAYSYVVGAWLPPITGLEYGAFTTFQLPDGTTRFYVGDEWGRVFQYFVGDIEGVPAGTTSAAVTAAAAGSVTAAGAAFYTTDDALVGLPVAVVDPAGVWQIRTIASNTATQINLDLVNGAPWTTIPDATYTVVVGGINWFWRTPLIQWGLPLRQKRGGYVYGEVRSVAAGFSVVLRGRFDDVTAPETFSETVALAAGASWGSGLWGTMVWGLGANQAFRRRIGRTFVGAQFEISNRYPNQAAELVTFGVTGDLLPLRMASS